MLYKCRSDDILTLLDFDADVLFTSPEAQKSVPINVSERTTA